MGDFNNVWVCGGSSGIGQAVSMMLVFENKAGFVHSTGHSQVDVRDSKAMYEFMREEGPFDAIVYSAGVNYPAWLHQTEDELWEETFEVNVKGFFNVVRNLNDQEPARVVAVSSDADHRPMRASMAYCASKAALTMAAKVAARELADRGHRINVVRPGMVADTEMTAKLDELIPDLRGWDPLYMQEYELNQQVIKRRAECGEIAQVVLDVLCGPDYLNGAVIDVNGGR